jgi:Tol biopolymer transport system component/tRNA A-37 threonylcarbamoyl transferase component Bud32
MHMGDKAPDGDGTALGGTLDAGEASDPERAAPRPADLLGKRYRIEKLVGAGGMGSVYRALDEALGKEVALKFLDEGRADSRVVFERLCDEVILAQEVSHRNVCRTYDLEEIGDRWVVKMEYIDGETLAQRIARDGPLDVGEALVIARQIVEGLGAAHERGIIHRDLKPHNVLLEAETGRVVLMDFGLARMAELDGRSLEGIAGTPEFMAPEQARGREVDGRADLYALGCVLYYMLAGEVVFPAEGAMAAALRHVEDPPPDVRARRPEVPGWLAAIIARLLEKLPERRFADARSVLAALAGPRRRWPRLAAVGLGIAALAAAAASFAHRPAREWRPTIRELQPAHEENSDAPRWSPDGRSIAYFSDRDHTGHFRIYIDSLADGTSRPITPRGLFAIFPSWSRDGTAMFFHAEIDGHAGIHRVPIAGGAPEIVVADTFRPGAIDCGAGRLVFARADADRAGPRLVVRDAGGIERDLVRVAPGDEVLYYDCDRAGARVVYTLARHGESPPRRDVWLVGIDGSGARALTDDGKDNIAATFHPDGRSIVFMSARGGKYNIWELALAGGAPEQLTFGEGPDWTPAISPDGKSLLFQIDTTSHQIFAYGLDGSRRRLTSVVGGRALKLAASPDGRELVAGVRRGSREQVVIVPTAGGEERLLVDGRLPGFTPDGTEVVYVSAGVPGRVFAVARGGGAPRLVAELPGRPFDLYVARDRMIHVALLTADGLQAWRIPLLPGAPEREAPAPWSYVLPGAAGGWRAALQQEFGASLILHPFSVRLFGANARLEDSPARTFRAYGLAWDDDGASIVYHDRFAVHRLDLADGRDTVFARPAGQTTPVMAVSPDRQTVFMAEYVAHVRRQLVTNYGDRPRPR